MLQSIIAQRNRYAKHLADFIAATGATDIQVLRGLVDYVGAQGLWNSVRFFPLKSTQNHPSGTVVKGLGGWTSNDINLFGSVANPTTAGRAFDATDDRGTWDGTGIETLSELYVFDRQLPAQASLADTRRFGIVVVGNQSPLNFFYTGGAAGALTGETIAVGLDNLADSRRFGTTQAWSAGADTQFVTRFAQSGYDIWKSKATTTKATPFPSGTSDFRPSQAGWTSNSVVDISSQKNGAGYVSFTATTRVALLFCKTALTTEQRETITDYIDAL